MEIAGGGFINFFFRKKDLGSVIVAIHQADRRYGSSDYGKGKKVIVEFVSANPTGPMTIAHGRQAAVGDSLCRILKAAGYDVHAEYYLNDAGRQMNLLARSVWARYHELLGHEMALPEDGYKGEYVRQIARDIIEKKKGQPSSGPEDKAIEYCGAYAVERSELDQDGFRENEVHFDHYFSEKHSMKKSVEHALEVLRQKGFLLKTRGRLVPFDRFRG